jgi:3-hydroxybutyryl-CoA dehydrogenase
LAVEKIQVVGAGQMGSGIAQVAAQAGLAVHLADVDETALGKGLETIEKNLSRSVEKERISQEEMDEALARIESGTEYAADADLAIEAVVEAAEVKAEVFRALDGRLGEDAILATNTSSISITELAATTGRPEKFIGMHFFNPVPLMKLVEIVRGLQTADETYSAVHELAERLGKEPVEVNDFPGFVSNRVLMPMINEAIYCVMEGVAGPEEVDIVMKLGMNHPMGPPGARRPHRPGYLPAHHGGPARGLRGYQIPALPAPEALRGRRAARPQEREGVLRVRVAPRRCGPVLPDA